MICNVTDCPLLGSRMVAAENINETVVYHTLLLLPNILRDFPQRNIGISGSEQLVPRAFCFYFDDLNSLFWPIY